MYLGLSRYHANSLARSPLRSAIDTMLGLGHMERQGHHQRTPDAIVTTFIARAAQMYGSMSLPTYLPTLPTYLSTYLPPYLPTYK